MNDRKLVLEDLSRAHPLDAELFGTMGVITAELCARITKNLVGAHYHFMDISEFQELKGPARANQIYWTEMLYRVHWAASLNLLRHRRWQAGCIASYNAPANLLSFGANLRGLLECSLDAFYSLRPVPSTLANLRNSIHPALAGDLRNRVVCKELEDRLIHFVYARKLNKSEKSFAPESHQALEPRDYRKILDSPERELITELYDELCRYFHPTAFSLSWLYQSTEVGDINITDGLDTSEIRILCEKHRNAIELALVISVTASALCLKALNWFTLSEVWCMPIEHWDFSDIPAWMKLEAVFSREWTAGSNRGGPGH